jgi:hypothetical protein
MLLVNTVPSAWTTKDLDGARLTGADLSATLS